MIEKIKESVIGIQKVVNRDSKKKNLESYKAKLVAKEYAQKYGEV